MFQPDLKMIPISDQQQPGAVSARSGLVLALSSLAACLMLLARAVYTRNFFYFFLPWNLFLAWIPYLISASFSIQAVFRNGRLKALVLFSLWLLFLPNSPYILTDFVHLSPRPGVPLWFDLLLIALFAWTGLMLGLASMARMHSWLKANFEKGLVLVLMGLILLSCSFGIYLGRVLRWNSWDLLVRPEALGKSIAAQFLHPFHHPQTFGMTLSFSVFLAFSYCSLQVFSKQGS